VGRGPERDGPSVKRMRLPQRWAPASGRSAVSEEQRISRRECKNLLTLESSADGLEEKANAGSTKAKKPGVRAGRGVSAGVVGKKTRTRKCETSQSPVFSWGIKRTGPEKTNPIIAEWRHGGFGRASGGKEEKCRRRKLVYAR